jgi:hypothetical protein
MKSWRWFVGQVTRLRRSIVPVFGRAVRRRPPADVRTVVADEPASGPPAHWVELVRRGAPGLLEPSFRRRGEPSGQPVAARERVAASPAEPQRQPDSSGEPERDDVSPETPVDSPRSATPVRAALLRRVLRRKRSPSRVRAAAVATSPETVPEEMAPELPAATRPVRKPAPDRVVGETTSSPRFADEPERLPQPSEVVEFDAPSERRTVRVEPAARPARPVTAGAVRAPAAEPFRAEARLGAVDTGHVRKRAAAPAAPSHEPGAERLGEAAIPRPTARPEPSLRLESAPPAFSRRPDEPLSTEDVNRWPELPPPLDQPDGDVEVALRAWDRQRRLDREQTRL